MTTPGPTEARFAARCRFLRTTLSSAEPGHLANTCQHILREDRDCVGPFLDDFETDCGLWEPGDSIPNLAAASG